MKAQVNSVLEKKLEELESLLEVVTFNDDDPNIQKILFAVLFARTLLTAEISSRPMDVERDEEVKESFRRIANRLTEIEDFVTDQLSGHDVPLIEPEMGNVEINAGIVNCETGSVDSVVESCLNESSKEEEEEEGEEEKEEVEAEEWALFQDASSEEERDITFPAVAMVKEEAVFREVTENRRVRWRALVCFGLIGLVGGMISLFGYVDDNMEDTFSLTPT